MMRLSYLLVCAVSVTAQCPSWKLPWGSYSADLGADNICAYRNVRFASPPTGNLRFQAPQYPPSPSSPANQYDHPSCIQMEETPCIDDRPLVGTNQSCFGDYFGNQTEDCLFLDVYVPQAAFKSSSKVPVAVWFYGGGYIFGSKSQYDPSKLPFYNGTGFVNSATTAISQSLILVTGNYRLGAFGWLAGEYFEQHGGQPNAGLLDQRAILQFVSDHISEVNGDSGNVSVWGESAGASSILHHIAMPANIAKPLFKRAIVMSPAYQWMWDQKYALNSTFTRFYRNVSQINGPNTDICSPRQAPLDCLRNNPRVTTEVLSKVNQLLFQEAACKGIIPVGPAVDGKLVTTLAPINYYNGKVAQNIDSVLISHVNDEVAYTNSTESFSFIPLGVRRNNNEQSFDNFLQQVFAGPPNNPNLYARVWNAIKTQYPIQNYKDQIARTRAVITDSSFTCNTRFMINTFLQNGKSVYAENYAVLSEYGGDTHASDLLPAFQNKFVDYTKFLECYANLSNSTAPAAAMLIQNWTGQYMQQYYASHAIRGDPNMNAYYTWLPANNNQACSAGSQFGTCVKNVMKPGTSYFDHVWSETNSEDTQTSNSTCSFWQKMAVGTMNLYNANSANAETELPSWTDEQKVFQEL